MQSPCAGSAFFKYHLLAPRLSSETSCKNCKYYFLANIILWLGIRGGEPVRLPPSLSEPPESPPRIPLTDRVDSNEEGCGAVQYCNNRVFPVAPASTVRLRQITFLQGSTTRNLQVKATTPGFLETACKNCSMSFLQNSSSGGQTRKS